MGGRHRTAAGSEADPHNDLPGRRRPRQGLQARALIVATVLLVLTAGTATALAARTGLLGCLGSQTQLKVLAAPDIAPALEKIAQQFHDGQIGASGRCADVVITARDSAQAAAELGNGRFDDASKAEQWPDVWVPDASTWVEQAQQAKAGQQQDQDRLRPAGSIAHTPVVVALIRPVADQLNWQQAKIGWIDLLKRATADAADGMRLGVVDPTRSATSTLGLVTLRNLTAKAGSPPTAALGVMRAISTNVMPTERSLLDRLPQTSDEVADPAQKRLHAFPHTEQGVWRYNIANPAVPLAAIYPKEGAPQLDYPFVLVSPQTRDGDRRETAQDFLRAVQAPRGRRILQAQAFRTVDDEAGPAVSPAIGLRAAKPPSVTPAKGAEVQQALRIWTVVNLNTRLLAVIDISGSMLTVDPGATRSRIALTGSGAGEGLRLLSGESEVGLWVFSTNLAGTTDYQQIIDVGPLGESFGGTTRRDILLTRLDSVTAIKGGATGLYDTALAAYRKMTAGYNPKELNSVVLFTDGKNEDPNSITLPTLLAELKKLYNPSKPVRIYTIGFGTDIDAAALKAIAAATDGQTLVTTDPTAVQDVFLRALAARL